MPKVVTQTRVMHQHVEQAWSDRFAESLSGGFGDGKAVTLAILVPVPSQVVEVPMTQVQAAIMCQMPRVPGRRLNSLHPI